MASNFSSLKEKKYEEFSPHLCELMDEPEVEKAATLLQRRYENAVAKNKQLYKSACFGNFFFDFSHPLGFGSRANGHRKPLEAVKRSSRLAELALRHYGESKPRFARLLQRTRRGPASTTATRPDSGASSTSSGSIRATT